MFAKRIRIEFLLPATICLGIACAILLPQAAVAAPWDVDMYSQQSLKTNEVARAPAEGTVPLGSKPFRISTEEAEKNLKNPVAVSKESILRGGRIWRVNCYPCHGYSGNGKSPVGPLMGAPNLLEDRFRTYSDGRVFGTIMNGVRAMPRYGFKFSEAETWDVVNYLKFLQGEEVAGMERPKE